MLKKCAQQHFSTKFQCPSSQVFLQRRKLHVFGIETSCDDTAAAIVNDLGIVSECKITHGEIVAKHGGVFPNAMAEAQKQTIDHVIQETILHAQDANIMHKLDAIAVTCGPGLPPCLKQVSFNFFKFFREFWQPKHWQQNTTNPLFQYIIWRATFCYHACYMQA